MERHLEGTAEAARVLRLFDNVGDVLNAANPCDHKPLRRGYNGSAQQEAILDEAMRELVAMRIGKAKHMYAFQRGWMVTIQSVRGLLADMKEKFGEQTYLLTRRLTQDQLESMFGAVRGRGGSNWNPTALEAKGRLRLIMLQSVRQAGQNPMGPDPEEVAHSDDGDDAPDADDDEVGDEVEALQHDVSRAELENLEDGTTVQMELATFATASLGTDPESELEPIDAEEEAENLEAEYMELLAMEEKRSSRQGATTSSTSSCQGATDLESGVPAARSAMAYVAGAVARKCRKASDGFLAQAEKAPREALWTQLLSMGGLTIPSQSFLSTFESMDREFSVYHSHEPDQLSRREGVVSEMTELLVNKLHVDRLLAKKFARVRTFIRMQCINIEQQLEAMERRANRKRKQHSQ
ncbi:Transposable element P transposase [Amphibalanus amphitrite]|uniref:Transposable element P transposase n=1 Tax=Amphibalanus amphitrite TaxID=1232801 RepID=A0A6A4VKF0_AMPAM|nr:Transposable element P transposase [Amphibalanus amphitrite]